MPAKSLSVQQVISYKVKELFCKEICKGQAMYPENDQDDVMPP